MRHDLDGYTYDLKLMCYVNHQTKKIFSASFVNEFDLTYIKECIDSPNTSGEWQFFFHAAPSNELKKFIINSLEEPTNS